MKIALIEDDGHTRARIASLLARCLPTATVTSFERLTTALSFAAEHLQDYWLVDLGLPDGSGVDLIRTVRAKDALAAMEQGGTPLSPMIASRLLETMRTPIMPAKPQPVRPAAVPYTASVLTPKETELLNLLSRGYTYAEAAELMQVALSTIQTHVRGIYAKLAVGSRAEAVFEAKAMGLIR